MSPNPLVFWNATVCPYAHRTWLALEEKKLPYKTVEIDLQNKSQVNHDALHSPKTVQELGTPAGIILMSHDCVRSRNELRR